MIKVLHVLGGLNAGGSENLVMNIYRHIDTSLIQFDFVIHVREEDFFVEEILKRGGHIYNCPQYKIINHFQYVKWWEDFLDSHQNEYKVIHGHSRSTAGIYLKICKSRGLTTISHSHSVSNGKGIKGIIKDLMQHKARYYSDYKFACSQKAGQWMYGKGVLSDPNYKTINNAIDCNRFEFNEQKRKEIRQVLGIQDCFVLGHVGRFTTVKNQAFLLHIYEELSKSFSNLALLFVGDGEMLDEMKKKCKDKNFKIVFAGAVNNTQDYYSAMDVFCFPSLYEGLGIAAIEAQAAGLPCFVSNKVPEEVAVTDLIHFLPLEFGRWENAIEITKLTNGTNNNRKTYCRKVAESGYDITELTKKMTVFYFKAYSECR